MTTTNPISRRAAFGTAGVASAALLIGHAARADATTTGLADITDAAPVPEQVGGGAGLASGQVARLSFHMRRILGTLPPDPCDVALRIRNLAGDLLAEHRFSDVAANHGGFVDYRHPAGLAAGLASRVQLVAEIEHTAGYTVGGSLELINPVSGVTALTTDPCVIPAPTVLPS